MSWPYIVRREKEGPVRKSLRSQISHITPVPIFVLGTMICAYLLYSGLKKSADEALAWYDEKRTKDRKGVTIPSQRRYVQYFSKLVCSSVPYSKISLNVSTSTRNNKLGQS